MRRLVLVATALIFFVGAAGTYASPPTPVTITADTTFPPDGGPAFGPFTASAVVCPSGGSIDVSSQAVGFQSVDRLQILVRKQFTCADGSGSFVLLLRVHLTFQPTFTVVFTWSVLSGTGAYAKLHGAGTGFAVPTPNGVFDTYTGELHID